MWTSFESNDELAGFAPDCSNFDGERTQHWISKGSPGHMFLIIVIELPELAQSNMETNGKVMNLPPGHPPFTFRQYDPLYRLVVSKHGICMA